VGVGRGGVKQAVEAIEQRPRARDGPRVEEGKQKLRVVGFELREVVDFPHLMADDHTEVPQRMKESAQEALFRVANPTAEQHQQIDVRVQTQMAPPVPAESDDGDIVRRTGFAEELPQHRIDPVGVPLERAPPAGAPQDVRLQLRPRRLERGWTRGTGARLGH
jgi:hypothetical protein